MSEQFNVVDLPDGARRRGGASAAIFESVVTNVGRAVRVDVNGTDTVKRRNVLQNGLSLFCSRYHGGKFSTRSTIKDGAIYLWVEPKT